MGWRASWSPITVLRRAHQLDPSALSGTRLFSAVKLEATACGVALHIFSGLDRGRRTVGESAPGLPWTSSGILFALLWCIIRVAQCRVARETRGAPQTTGAGFPKGAFFLDLFP